MKDYKRLTERDEFDNAEIIGVDSVILATDLSFDELNKLTSALNKIADLEDKIERGEIDYVADKDKEIARLTAERDDYKSRAEAAEKDRDEWKRRAEVAEKAEERLKSAKQKPRKTNIYYGTARLEHLNGDPYEILCPHCGENIKFYVSNTCPYCNALLFKKTGRETKYKYSDILQLKSFCERNGIKCVLTRRRDDFNGKFKDSRDGYKITFLNGDVIQCADTNGYFEFHNCHNEVDGKWIGLQKAKSFVLRYKNWLDLNNKPKREIEEDEE